MNKPGKLIVLSGPSGVGKTTICTELVRKRKDIVYSISATSRKKRKNEQNGREYFFLSENEFKEWIKQGLFAEYALVHGNYYGTPKKYLDENLAAGLNVLMDVDVQGAKRLMTDYPDGIYVFIVPPDFSELERRLLNRDTDEKPEIDSRLKTARQEMGYVDDYEFVVENHHLEETVDKIISIIDAETKKD